jgi:hypothetical protein
MDIDFDGSRVCLCVPEKYVFENRPDKTHWMTVVIYIIEHTAQGTEGEENDSEHAADSLLIFDSSREKVQHLELSQAVIHNHQRF